MVAVLVLSMLASWWVRGSKLASRYSRSGTTRTAPAAGRADRFREADVIRAVGRARRHVGAVWAYYLSFIYPQFAVDPLVTIGMVLMVYLGGRGTLWGPVLARSSWCRRRSTSRTASVRATCTSLAIRACS